MPEIPYNIDSIAHHLKKRRDDGKEFSIVVVAEGALSEKEATMDKKTFKKARQAMQNSIGYRVARELELATGLESRVTVLGYVQRGGIPVPYDRTLATLFGTEAVHMLARGDFGKMVALQNGKAVGVPLEDIAGKIKKVPLDSQMILAGREVGTCFGD